MLDRSANGRHPAGKQAVTLCATWMQGAHSAPASPSEHSHWSATRSTAAVSRPSVEASVPEGYKLLRVSIGLSLPRCYPGATAVLQRCYAGVTCAPVAIRSEH